MRMTTTEDTKLDAALTGAPGADSELSALVRDLRAQAPEMTPHFAARLNDRVAALPAQRSRWRAALAPRRLLPVFAVAAVLGAVVTAGVVLRDQGESQKVSSVRDTSSESSGSDEGSSGSTGGGSAPSQARRNAAPPPEPSGASALNRFRTSPPAVPPGDQGVTAPGGLRKVQRDAQLTLTTAPSDVQDVADEVVSVTQEADGVVARSSVNVGDDGGSASFTLRVPTRRLDEALKRLSDLAHVGSLKQGSADITGSFVSAADRLSDARAERRALLKALGKATTPNAIASLRQRIRFNRSEIGALKGDLQALRRRADLATVSVQVVGRGATKGAAGGDAGWTPGDAAHDALRVLEVVAGVLLIAAAVLAPLGALALLVVLATGAARRRRREHALDAA